MSTDRADPICIHLVDPADGRLLQTWSFQAERVTIGRGERESIPLSDPYVSRLHAELVWTESGWTLLSRGRNGVFVNGRGAETHALQDGMAFRLGPTGPMFRFNTEAIADTSVGSGQATLHFDPDQVILLGLDREEVDKQAREVESTDYFQRLREQARQLRQKRSGVP